jgi:Phytanoyl-CoA dioxygenase (PhyH)
MLSELDRAEFAERGVVWLRGAFASDEAARMRRRVWARLARLGVAEDDPSTWAAADVTGLSKAIKRDRVFAALGSSIVRGAVDDLLGQDAWDSPREWGTILVTFPGQDRPWVLPARSWHTDYGWDLDPEPLFGVKVFAFFAEVRPRGGGTLVITGSHRVVSRFASSLAPQQPYEGHLLGRYLRRDDWFRALSRPGDDDPSRTARFMDRDHDADGIAVRVAELTGQPGDVVLTHPWVLHSWSSNTGSYPRMMLTKNLFRRGCFKATGG